MGTPSRRRIGRLSCFVVAGVLAIAGPADAEVVAKKAKKACDLLKRSEIERVTGQAVGKPKKSKIRSNICEWQVGSDATNHLSVLLERGSQAEGAYEAAKDPDLYQITEIDGLGKDAFAAEASLVWVLKNSKTALYVQALYPDATQSQLEDLAKVALPRA